MKTEALRELARAYDALHMAELDVDDGLISDEIENLMHELKTLMKKVIDSDELHT